VPHVSSKSCQALHIGCGTLGILLRVKQPLGALKQPGILGRERTSVTFHEELSHPDDLAAAFEIQQRKVLQVGLPVMLFTQ